MSVVDKIKSIGPGALVAAAFVGPGTVTTASVIGAEYAYLLVWTIAFSILATIVLQEMSARLGLVSNEGLGEALRDEFTHPLLKGVAVALVVSAIGVGTAAFQTGNIVGGAAGLSTITGISENVWGPLIGVVAAGLLWTGNYKLIERVFVGLVVVMGLAFVLNAVVVRPDVGSFSVGLVPTVPEGSAYLIAGLVGTTVVGYNLFLHASTVQERWDGAQDLAACRFDTVGMVVVGGLITTAIVVTAAAVFPNGTQIDDVGAMADQLEPVFGGFALTFFAIGLFAAGFTSSMSAPLAGAYATAGALGWERDLTATRFRAIWMTILGVGIVFSALDYNPVDVIVFAQVANGLLLPILAVFLIYAMNNDELLGEHTNSRLQNLLGVAVTIVAIGIGLQTLYDVLVL
ncbi:Nramp family divalent metal transporter [Natronobacterium gregoryi]|uniref:Divalent metal cation transporter n=2 Tax=Natronobacterium gregoryi TaxID=44930 RepID=L0AK80_NATGS|nr:Nramp family divalent metal transporter [Natronobacterium gregoryi]AFZ73465.1 Mn2+/Fe2- transporter, NRAMP family [Natronobacterium gregoryi SP2]ELY68662.1 natural resistance-associated macrophage protein [Natronobacterium gregoryi SP2]PLK20519.1 divalent metal cation transporter [Natronobacterium gregoryi SP2]SFI71337.1 NRAMP (natural resistance-associated macrophage protein) metal ion transporters [Natronobacterium gregoryi]